MKRYTFHIVIWYTVIIKLASSQKSQVCDLPLKDFPQRGVLDPLDFLNFTLGHGALKQHLNHIILLRRVGEMYELKDKKEHSADEQ